MFCSGCGVACITNAKFCHQCGKELSKTTGSSAKEVGSTSTAGNTTIKSRSFDSYCARKKVERSKFFKTSGTKAKKAKVEDKQATEVKINVGVMVMKDGRLSIKRGATLPLTVLSSIGAQQLLTKAVEKHHRFNNNVINRLTSHRLLYPDVKEVITIPGSQEAFTLQKYKEEIDKPYSRITFFLCSSNDYLATIGNCQSDSSDDELTYSIYDTRPTVNKSERGEPSVQSIEDVSMVNVEASETNASISSSTAAVGSARCSAAELDDEVSILSPKPQHIQCPICLESYPFAQIETHADNCSMWLLEEDEFSCDFLEPLQQSTSNSIVNDDPVIVEKEFPLSEGPKKMLIQQISHVAKTVMGDKEPKRLTVRRKFIWNDFKNARQRKISPDYKVKVVFSGEPAVDDGGPRRELFSELLSFIQRKFFSNGKPIQSTLALTSGDFKLCGEVMGMSILQGGPAPNFLPTNIVSYITGEVLLPSDNQNHSYHTLGESLVNATSDAEIRTILAQDTTLDVLQEIGYSGIPQRETLETAKTIIKSLCIKDQLGEYLPQVLQIESGLSECGLITPIKSNPKLWQPVFESGSMFKLSAEEILDEITVEFSESQMKKEAEIDTYKYFCDVLEAIETGVIEDLQLTDFLKWLTGTGEVPPLGFPKKFCVTFVHGCLDGCRCRPTVSTCDTTVKIPVHINSEEVMKEMLFSAIRDSYGFGNL